MKNQRPLRVSLIFWEFLTIIRFFGLNWSCILVVPKIVSILIYFNLINPISGCSLVSSRFSHTSILPGIPCSWFGQFFGLFWCWFSWSFLPLSTNLSSKKYSSMSRDICPYYAFFLKYLQSEALPIVDSVLITIRNYT